ncbi:MAG: CoA-binding protein [Thermovirgaceae bacterium]
MEMDNIIEDYVCKPSKIAVVGASRNRDRPVYEVMEYLKEQDFDMYPVNPSSAGETIHDLLCYDTLREVPETVDIVALFVAPKHQETVLEDLRGLPYKPVVWMQPGAENDEAEKNLKERGYEVVKGACLMMTHQVYCSGEG